MERLHKLRSIDPCIWIAVLGGLVACVICLYDLSLPNVLTGVHGVFGQADGYDDGVYLGVAMRLVHGSLPYKDFVFLQPPGISLVLSPIAAIARFTSERDALVLARLLTMVVIGANATLVGLLLRHRGKVAVGVASLTLAIYPLAVAASSTVTLEPYLVFFCLLGFTLLFSKGELATLKRIFFGGLALGFAGATKIWAILPVIAVVVVFIPLWKRALRPAIIGIAIGFVVPTLPFAAFSFTAFFHDVISTQFARSISSAGGSGGSALSLSERLSDITGTLPLIAINPYLGLAEVIGVIVLIALVVTGVVVIRRTSIVERLIVASTIIVGIGMLLPHDFYDHYAYFPATFLALFIGFAIDLAREALRPKVLQRLGENKRARMILWTGLPSLVFAGLCIFSLQQQGSYAKAYLQNAFDYNSLIAIPSGACVVTDFPTLTLDVNRFESTVAGCPQDIDPLGNFLANDNGAVPPVTQPYPIGMVLQFNEDLMRADYVVLANPKSDYLPFTTSEFAWFATNYRLVTSQTGMYVYQHISAFAPGFGPTAS